MRLKDGGSRGRVDGPRDIAVDEALDHIANDLGVLLRLCAVFRES